MTYPTIPYLTLPGFTSDGITLTRLVEDISVDVDGLPIEISVDVDNIVNISVEVIS